MNAELILETSFVLDGDRRIMHTREPRSTRGSSFTFIRTRSSVAWATHASLPRHVADELAAIARTEPPTDDLAQPPAHREKYLALLPDHVADAGPGFAFPTTLTVDREIVELHDEHLLTQFHGWTPGEIAEGCAPMMAILDGDVPVSICFSARFGSHAAEAGVNTADAYRGRGLAARVTAAWAAAIRAQDRIPMYSTSWTNTASLAVTRKLALEHVGTSWGLRPAQ